MKIELAYASEQCAAAMREIESAFFIPFFEKAERPPACDPAPARSARPIKGTRMISASPPIGTDAELARGIGRIARLLKSSLFFDDSEARAKASTFLNIYRAFLETLGTVSRTGAVQGADLILALTRLSKCCIERGRPRKADPGEKTSWSSLFEAQDASRKSAAFEECASARAAIASEISLLTYRWSDMGEVLRDEARKIISASENLVEACNHCIFRHEVTDATKA